MSVNIYQNGTLTPIAGKTVPAPTPDYVDEQYNNSTTYSKGMTCISGNKRYRYINSTASSGHQPPNATYWEVLSVSDQLTGGNYEELLRFTGTTSLTSGWQRLPQKQINQGWASITSKYRYIMILILGYTSSQGSTEFGQYYPVCSAVYPTAIRRVGDYLTFTGLLGQKATNVQLSISTSVVNVDLSIYDNTTTTYNTGFVIYGIK